MDKIKEFQTLNKRLTEMLDDCLYEISNALYNDKYDNQAVKNLVQLTKAINNTIDDNNTAIMYEYRNNC